MSAELQASRRDATLILTLSNPGSRNSLHPDMYAAAIETLSTAERDDSVRAVVLTGADRMFCAGSNPHRLQESRTRDNADLADDIDRLHGWIDAIRDCPKPVLAAVEGSAAGAGFALALACDFIVAGTSASFALPAAAMGLTPEGGASWFVTRALPRQLAAEVLMEGKALEASRLHALGLVNRVVADGTALDEALDWSDRLATLSPNALEHIKSLMREAAANTLAQQLAAEKLHFIESLHHRDAQEGLAALLEKRSPQFK